MVSIPMPVFLVAVTFSAKLDRFGCLECDSSHTFFLPIVCNLVVRLSTIFLELVVTTRIKTGVICLFVICSLLVLPNL